MRNSLPTFEHLIPFTSDLGFKKAFVDEKDTLFARRAIQVLASLDEPIKELCYDRNELERRYFESRAGLLDVKCSDVKKNIYIIEMQVGKLEVLFERLYFYVLQTYHNMVKKGKGGFDHIQPIYCICIVDGKLYPGERLYHEVKLKNQDQQIVFDLVTFYIVELGKFDKTKEACESDLDKLLFTMKNGKSINLDRPSEQPSFWKEDWLQSVVEKLKSDNLTPEEREIYEREWAQAASTKTAEKRQREKNEAKVAAEKVKTAAEKAKAAAAIKVAAAAKKAAAASAAKAAAAKKAAAAEREKAAAANAKTKATQKKSVQALLEAGLPPEQVAASLDLPLDFVKKIQRELGPPGV